MDAVETPLIIGPTGVGKSAVAMALASLLPVEIISADSRQVYRGLDIVTAKPTQKERNRVSHHLLDLVQPGERYSAGRFLEDVSPVLAAIRQRGNLPLVVGGTGLYLKALVAGLFLEPELPAERRRALAELTGQMDPLTLVRWADRLDPEHAPGGGRHRAQRAIEIAILTGRALTWWQRTAATQSTVQPWIVRLTVPRPVLHQRIRRRAEAMVQRGLLAEIAAVLADGASPDGPGLDGIGAREAVAVLQGRLPEELLVDSIATATRQYAKRQETWFRHQLPDSDLVLDAARTPEQLAAVIAETWKSRNQ